MVGLLGGATRASGAGARVGEAAMRRVFAALMEDTRAEPAAESLDDAAPKESLDDAAPKESLDDAAQAPAPGGARATPQQIEARCAAVAAYALPPPYCCPYPCSYCTHTHTHSPPLPTVTPTHVPTVHAARRGAGGCQVSKHTSVMDPPRARGGGARAPVQRAEVAHVGVFAKNLPRAAGALRCARRGGVRPRPWPRTEPGAAKKQLWHPCRGAGGARRAAGAPSGTLSRGAACRSRTRPQSGSNAPARAHTPQAL